MSSAPSSCFVDQDGRHTGGGTSSWKDFRELFVSSLILDIEEPRAVLNPCLHLVFVREHKLPSIIPYRVLTSTVLGCIVYLFENMDYTTTICRDCGEFLFLCLRICQSDGMLCHVLGFNVGSLLSSWPQLPCLPSLGHC